MAALTAAFVCWLLLTVLLSWIGLLAVTLFLFIIYVLQRRLRWPLELMVVAVFLVTQAEASAVWLPPEQIDLHDGRGVVGYVLTSESDWTTVLIEDNRSILIARTDDVAERRVCNLEMRASGRTIAQIIHGERGGLRNRPCPDDLENPSSKLSPG